MHPFLIAFDAPKSDLSCTRRHQSNTPLQALMLLNDPMFLECAQALAGRVLAEGPRDTAGRIRHAFRLCVAREPSIAELQSEPDAAWRLAGPGANDGDVVTRAAWTVAARVLLNLDEVIVRE